MDNNIILEINALIDSFLRRDKSSSFLLLDRTRVTPTLGLEHKEGITNDLVKINEFLETVSQTKNFLESALWLLELHTTGIEI